jgi:AraC family transcriptional regulator
VTRGKTDIDQLYKQRGIDHGSTPERHRGGLPRYLLKRVLDYIDEHLAADISLTQLATVAGISAHYFAELFRQSTGHVPYRYVLLRKIERAKQSLRHPRRSVLDAALEVGFQNPSHFARTFRRFVGVSPSQFQSNEH